MAAAYSVTDALALAKQANRVLTEAASATWNRMSKVIEQKLRTGNPNYVLDAFNAHKSIRTENGGASIYMNISGLKEGGVSDEDIDIFKQSAGAMLRWRVSVFPKSNTATLELWITVVTNTTLASPLPAPVLDTRHVVRRALEDRYTASYLFSWVVVLFIAMCVSYFFLDASPDTRAIIFG